jgi:NitT/TauT family transport system substrate-binding protein
MMDRRRCLVGCAATVLVGCSSPAIIERAPEVRLYVPSRNPVAFLPVYAAQRTGLFLKAGANVRFQDSEPGGDAFEALESGAADVAAGLFEDALQAAARGRRCKAFALMTRSPLFAIVAPSSARRRVDNIADLLTTRTALPALGSSEEVFLNYNFYVEGGVPVDLKKVVPPAGASVVDEVAAGRAGAAVVDGIALRQLAQRIGDLKVLADTRTIAGVLSVYGVSTYPGAALIASQRWLESNAREAPKLASAVLAAAAWIRGSRPEVAAAALPDTLGEKMTGAVIEAVRESVPLFSQTAAIPDDGANAALKALGVSYEALRRPAFNLRDTYTNSFLPTRQPRSS